MATDHRGREVHGGKRTDDEHYERVMSMRQAQTSANAANAAEQRQTVFNPNVTDVFNLSGGTVTKDQHAQLLSQMADIPIPKQSKSRSDGRVKTPHDSNIDSYPNTITY